MFYAYSQEWSMYSSRMLAKCNTSFLQAFSFKQMPFLKEVSLYCVTTEGISAETCLAFYQINWATRKLWCQQNWKMFIVRNRKSSSHVAFRRPLGKLARCTAAPRHWLGGQQTIQPTTSARWKRQQFSLLPSSVRPSPSMPPPSSLLFHTIAHVFTVYVTSTAVWARLCRLRVLVVKIVHSQHCLGERTSFPPYLSMTATRTEGRRCDITGKNRTVHYHSRLIFILVFPLPWSMWDFVTGTRRVQTCGQGIRSSQVRIYGLKSAKSFFEMGSN